MKNQLKNAFQWMSLFFVTGCASIGSPTGGPKDETAPKVVTTYPKNGQTNVKPEKIILEFDEAIQTIDLNRQLIIAPFTENTYKTKVKDKTIEITFNEPWQDNTTYSLNFRKSLADITEKNPAKKVVLTFSTGTMLDSGRVTGTVTSLFSTTIPKDVSVLLYPTNDTIQVTKGRPLYVTSADSSGAFNFQNIREGNYFIYAVSETNNNLRYDNEKEMLAFAKDSIQVRPSVTGVNLKLYTQDITAPRIAARRSFTNAYEVDYNEGLVSATLTKVDTDTEVKWLIGANGKTIRIFPSKPEEQRWIVQAYDSAANLRIDTVTVRLAGKAAPRTNNSFRVLNGNTIKPGDTLKLGFEVPTKILDPQGAVTLVLDTITKVMSTDLKQLMLNKDQTELTLRIPFNAKKEISISLDTTKVIPFIGTPYAKTSQQVVITERTSTGSLKIMITTSQKKFMVQLLKENKIVKEVKDQKTILWDNLEPGRYQVRVLVDENENGKWDNGLLSERRLPELVILHPEIFEIRADWEIEVSPPINF